MNTDLREILLNVFHFQTDECRGKVVVVTGAGRGIGRQIAEAFAILGANVVIAEVSEQGRTAAEEICRGGGQARYIRTDVSNGTSVCLLAAEVAKTFGPPDIVINNAIQIAVAPVAEMDETLWDRIISVNLRGTYLVCRTFLPDLLSRKGILINMISTEAMPGLSAYIASKQGILGFTQSLALEVGPAGVRVIPFGPGMVDTPGIRGVADDLAPQLGIAKEQFLTTSLHATYDGLMPPEHAGAAAAYLALRLADTYHGQAVTGYEVLEQAGLLQSPEEMAGSMHAAQLEKAASAADPQEALRLAQQVREIVIETGREFEKLPAFVRPLARGGFKSKSGASLEEWQKILGALQPAGLPQAAAALPARLEKLIAYYQGVPAETARFTKDKAMLDEVRQTCASRITLILALIRSID